METEKNWYPGDIYKPDAINNFSGDRSPRFTQEEKDAIEEWLRHNTPTKLPDDPKLRRRR